MSACGWWPPAIHQEVCRARNGGDETSSRSQDFFKIEGYSCLNNFYSLRSKDIKFSLLFLDWMILFLGWFLRPFESETWIKRKNHQKLQPQSKVKVISKGPHLSMQISCVSFLDILFCPVGRPKKSPANIGYLIVCVAQNSRLIELAWSHGFMPRLLKASLVR